MKEKLYILDETELYALSEVSETTAPLLREAYEEQNVSGAKGLYVITKDQLADYGNWLCLSVFGRNYYALSSEDQLIFDTITQATLGKLT